MHNSINHFFSTVLQLVLCSSISFPYTVLWPDMGIGCTSGCDCPIYVRTEISRHPDRLCEQIIKFTVQSGTQKENAVVINMNSIFLNVLQTCFLIYLLLLLQYLIENRHCQGEGGRGNTRAHHQIHSHTWNTKC